MVLRALVPILTILFASLTSTLALYDGSSDVQVFENKSDFRKRVIEGDGISLVQFYAPWCGHCKQFQPGYDQVASLLKGIATVAAVDAASDGPQKSIASNYGVTGFPTMKLFYGKTTEDVQTRDPNELMNTILKAVQSLIQERGNSGEKKRSSSSSSSSSSQKNKSKSKVMELNASNFEEKVYKNPDVVAVAFVAPWCGHCKMLLPEWEEAAAKLDGQGAVLGVVDATVENDLASKYEVQGFPTIKIFAGGLNNVAMEYQGGRQMDQIVQYVLGEVDRSGVPKEIPELTSADLVKDSCEGSNKICVLFALPHILDSGAEGRNRYRDIMTAASKAVRGMSFQFMWFEGGSNQLELENSLELTFGFPAVAAYSMDKGVYAVHRASFTESNIRKFLMGITTGKVSTYKIANVPTINTVEPWNGKDGEPIEEESLADIMGWDDNEDEL
mmetsp:Transcript_2768/g.4179  ORF Transcript_2768/g.4179 Transcript_2768/m.4179 type:complete len:444 (-) Transcript_2768:281-1612(-)